MEEIKGFEGLYAATEDGKIWSHKSQKFLAPRNIANGYQQVSLFKNGRCHQMLIHRLIAMTFIPNPSNLPYINHKDERKNNNSVSNLEWCDIAYNNTYGTKCQRQADKINKPVYCVELDEVFPSQTIAAQELGLDQRHISNCCRGIRKTHGDFHFEYYTEDEPNA